MKVDFEYYPGEYVTISMFGLNYPGRIFDCRIQDGNVVRYSVNYVFDGKITNDIFDEDDLTPVPQS